LTAGERDDRPVSLTTIAAEQIWAELQGNPELPATTAPVTAG